MDTVDGRAFRIFWVGQALSVFGSYCGQIALPLLVLQATGSLTQMGLVTGIQGIGTLLAGLAGGPIVDRLDRRRLMIGCDIGLLVTFGLVPLVWWTVGPVLWLLYGVACVAAVFKMLFSIAYITAIPSLVGRDQIIVANGRLEATYGVMAALGPATAGLLAARFGAVTAIALDALTFAASAVSLGLIRFRPVSVHERASPLAELAAGVRFLRTTPVLWALTWILVCFSLLLASTENLAIYAVQDVFGLSDAVVGLVLGGAGLGAALTSLTVAALRRRIGFAASYLGGIALCGVALLLASGAPTIWTFALAIALFFSADILSGINSMTVRQEVTPDYLLGRVTAAFWTLINVPMPIGAALLAAWAERSGVRLVFGVLGLLGIALAVAGCFTAVRRYQPEAAHASGH